jgi:hypothetical protein
MRKKKGSIRLHQLAMAVLAGETTSFPWMLLRSAYFTEPSDADAARRLAQWAKKYGIEVSPERPNSGPHNSDKWLRFSVPRLWMPCC